MVSRSVPPEPSGSAIIAANLARHFGPDEMILAGENPSDLPPVTWNDSWARLAYIARSLPRDARGRITYRRIQIPLLTARIVRLVRKHRVPTLLGVFPSEEYLAAAYLAARLTRTRLIGYFHNTYVENRSGSRLARAKKLQDAVFNYASHVFVMSQGMLDLYKRNYPGLSCSALTHSFNGDIPAFEPTPPIGSTLKVALLGNINESCLDATKRVCDAVKQRADIQLRLISGTARTVIAKYGLLNDPDQQRTVPYEQVRSELQWADVVALPHGFTGGFTTEEYETIFPTRTIDYLLCGRPILAHSPAGCFLNRFLAEHECAHIIDQPNVPAVSEAFDRLRSDKELRNRLVKTSLETAAMFHASHVAGVLRSRLA
jgi:hypothetical protein